MATRSRDDPAHPATIRVLLIDDHPIVHQGVERVLEHAPDVRLSSALSAAEGVAMARTQRPHIVLLDLHLGDASAPKAAVALRAARPGVKLLLFTGDSSRGVGQVATLIGAEGVVHKSDGCAVLTRAIRDVACGAGFHDPSSPCAGRPLLSRREYQVLQHLARGESNPEIARCLGLAPNTVKSYVQALLSRLDARNRLDAVVKAQQAGML